MQHFPHGVSVRGFPRKEVGYFRSLRNTPAVLSIPGYLEQQHEDLMYTQHSPLSALDPPVRATF